MSAAHVPSRTAMGVRAVVLLALAAFFPTVLVRNGSDNAYIFFPLVSMALVILSLPFAIAGLLPERAARGIVARAGIILVWSVGGFCCVVLLLSIIPAVTHSYTGSVLMSHLVGLALLLPVVLGIGWRLRR